MKNIKTRDIIFYAFIASLGILFIWVVLGTDLIFDHSGSTEVAATPGEEVKNNFSMLNAEVPKKEATEGSDKSVLINEEMEAERKLEEMRKRDEENKLGQSKPLDDVSTYMERGGKAVEQERASGFAIEPVKVPETSTNSNSKALQHTTRTQTVSPSPSAKKKPVTVEEVTAKTEMKPKKRTRSGNPSFDDGTPQVVKSMSDPGVSKGSAVIHGDQSVLNGGRVIIRMVEDFEIEGCTVISSNTMLTGNVSSSGQRLMVTFFVICDNGSKNEFEVYDATDNEKGIYVEVTTDEQAAGKEVARDVAQTGSSALGVPIVGRALSGISSKKLSSRSIKLESGKKLFIEMKKK